MRDDRVVVGVQIVGANRAHDDLAGVNAHANLQRNAFREANAVAMPAHGLLHP